jgi:hypothetical protein
MMTAGEGDGPNGEPVKDHDELIDEDDYDFIPAHVSDTSYAGVMQRIAKWDSLHLLDLEELVSKLEPHDVTHMTKPVNMEDAIERGLIPPLNQQDACIFTKSERILQVYAVKRNWNLQDGKDVVDIVKMFMPNKKSARAPLSRQESTGIQIIE